MTAKSWSEMTDAEKTAYVRDSNDRERAAQGLERYVTDPAVLDRIATLASPSLARRLSDEEEAS